MFLKRINKNWKDHFNLVKYIIIGQYLIEVAVFIILKQEILSQLFGHTSWKNIWVPRLSSQNDPPMLSKMCRTFQVIAARAVITFRVTAVRKYCSYLRTAPPSSKLTYIHSFGTFDNRIVKPKYNLA